MAKIPKTQWRSRALISAVGRLRQRSSRTTQPLTQNQVVSVVVSSARVARPEQGGRIVGATPQVPLVRVLDSFRQLKDPKSRVVGGFFYGSPDELTTDSRLDEFAVQQIAVDGSGDVVAADANTSPHVVFSGVASPGSKVSVFIADEVGQPIESRTVYTDAGGNWLAPFGRLSTLDESGLISVEVLPTTWAGAARPSFMTFEFPAQKIIAQGEKGRQGGRDFFAAVFEGGDSVGGEFLGEDF